MKEVLCHDMTPLTKEQLDTLQSIFVSLSDAQLIWVSGYLWGLIYNGVNKKNIIKNSTELLQREDIDSSVVIQQKIVIISGSQSGNARRLSEQLRDALIASSIDVVLFDARDFRFKKISTIKFLVIIISTYGEGEPPEEALSLYKYLFSKKAPIMKNTNFSVFGLGDRSYKYFAKAGKDLDNRLVELGACRLFERVDADLDFQNTANIWIKKIVFLLQEKLNFSVKKTLNNEISNAMLPVKDMLYCKEYPFIASLLSKQKITSRAALKDVHHLEIDISGSHLIYQPGDSLGVWYENDLCLIHEILKLLHFTGNERVEVQGKLIFLNEALRCCYELTQNTPIVVKKIADLTQNKKLLDLLLDNNMKKLHKFSMMTPIVEMIRFIDIQLSPQDLINILSPMKPRFYSISSSQLEVGEEEVHITVGVIRYTVNGRDRTGGASGYLADCLQENDKLRVFVVSNNNFRLPRNSDVPIVMIASGTGIAPFRAFMQHRFSEGALGENWLFFGNLRFIDDFLYQIEWQSYIKSGLLTRLTTAWSREQQNKVYVQDKLLKNGVELWNWIQKGAYFYVCGNANYMARDVEQALIKIVSEYGGMDIEKSNEFWDSMRIQRRYQRDVY